MASGWWVISVLVLSPIRLAISAVAGQVTNRSSHILSSLDNSGDTMGEGDRGGDHLTPPLYPAHS